MPDGPVAPSLKRFFDRLVRRSLDDLRMGGPGGDPVADYVAEIAAREAEERRIAEFKARQCALPGVEP